MKRKASDTKSVQGTARKDRALMTAVVDLPTPPPPQKYLPKVAHKYYDGIMAHLVSTKQLRNVDSFMVSMAANWIYIYEKHAALVNKYSCSGAIQKFKNGTKNVSPEWSVMVKADEKIQQYSRKFGMDLRSRETLLAFQVKKSSKPDPMGALLGGKKAK